MNARSPSPFSSLLALRAHIEGIIPPAIATVSGAGEPNVIHVSQAIVLDEKHFAISRQFFKKTKQNLAENPRVCMLVTDSITYLATLVRGRHVRAETSGVLFDSMRARIEAIAAMTGMSEVFRLEAVDVFEVDDIEALRGLSSDESTESAP